MNTNLKNKVILITGASGGIGMGMARAFAEEGARLILHYHTRRSVLDDFTRLLPGVEAAIIAADLRKEEDVERLFAAARERFGRVDTLIANAGVWAEDSVPLHEMELSQWRQTLETDLTSAFLCCREFLRFVKRQGQGNAVLIASTAGIFGEPGHADYAAAKSALAYGLTRTLKTEIARPAPHTADYCGGRLNCICPGWTRTPMSERHLEDTDAVRRVVATMALPQIARVEDIANAAVFLSSDTLARHITGQTVTIAGGMEGRLLWQAGEVDAGIV